MEWHVFSNHDLAGPSLDASQSALLLEGTWPCGECVGVRDSLDDQIDCRFDWIDEQAARWAEQLSNMPLENQIGGYKASPAFLNSLSLRYHLVKLLRVVAYFTEASPLRSGDSVELTIVRDRDEVYADLFVELCRESNAKLNVRWRTFEGGAPLEFPRNGLLRRLCSRVNRLLQATTDPNATPNARVVLCGNPRILDPVCQGLLDRGCRVWWLYDRFAFRSWLNWRRQGVGQLTCESDFGTLNHLSSSLPERLDCQGVNLTPSIERWMAERLRTHGRRQSRVLEQMDVHFQNILPHTLILDEDATPFARSAVDVGRRYGVGSYVLQHAVPSSRFAVTPVVADRILSWGRSSRRQLIKLGVPPEKIQITGSPQHDGIIGRFAQKRAAEQILSTKTHNPTGILRQLAVGTNKTASDVSEPTRPRCVLLLATFPHADDRPDLVGYHLTRNTYRQMLDMAFSVVGRMSNTELLVRPHPRMPNEPILQETLARFHKIHTRSAKDGPLEKWFDGVDCVLSCGSSAGVEATLAGLPAIELLPQGSNDLLPYDQWGMAGVARKKNELEQLLAKVFNGDWQPLSVPNRNVFGNTDQPAVDHVVDVVLSQDVPRETRSDVVPADNLQHQ